ncbi:hypothetical protein [Streptomyces aureocirculatus]|uniref:hypothetical protein n=1 Tax=Streptomyces aureocirculatus TaxID=67275 RepID=UPI0004CA29D7|nr:hypothetical protein [Streptomyces aureocirculatus]
MDEEQWVTAVSRISDPGVRAALVVQCGLGWVRPHRLDLRNAVDEALINAQSREGAPPQITRVLLHNLPAAVGDGPEGEAMVRSFAEWNHRLAASAALLSVPPPRVERLIIEGSEAGASLPDMVDVLVDGRWSDAPRTEAVLRIVSSPGITTPLTSYDVDLDGPFSDADPSIHM